MATTSVTAPVSLRSRDGRPCHFLAEHVVELVDGNANPVVYEGRAYVFTHVVSPTWGADPASGDQIYVFAEADVSPIGTRDSREA